MLSNFRQRLRQGKPVSSPPSLSNESATPTSATPRHWQQQPNVPIYEAHSGLSETEQHWRSWLHEELLRVMDLSLLDSLEQQEAINQVHELGLRLLNEKAVPVNQIGRQRIVQQISDDLLGLGPLEPLLADHSIADILVNGAQNIYVERHGKLYRTDARFRDNRHLLNIIDRIVSSLGRRIDESSPLVDARLKDGSRVNVIIPPLAIDGPSVSIRRFTVERLDAPHLIEKGSLTEASALVLQAVVRGRLNILISGGTGTGKTTLLNVMSSFIPNNERIITIEDSAELQLQQPHVVRLETRPANIENRGEVTQRELLKNSLRMRPDRIVIGEVRGAEAFDMLAAMNTGHDGSMTTVHANSARDALGRVENMVSLCTANLPIKALRQQIASALDVVVQLERHEDGRRRLVSLQEINGMEGETITMTEIFRFERQGLDEQGQVLGNLVPTGVVPDFRERLNKYAIDLPIELFHPDWMEHPA